MTGLGLPELSKIGMQPHIHIAGPMELDHCLFEINHIRGDPCSNIALYIHYKYQFKQIQVNSIIQYQLENEPSIFLSHVISFILPLLKNVGEWIQDAHSQTESQPQALQITPFKNTNHYSKFSKIQITRTTTENSLRNSLSIMWISNKCCKDPVRTILN